MNRMRLLISILAVLGIILITGSAQGIGHAGALALAVVAFAQDSEAPALGVDAAYFECT
jgi:NAD(P)-dependent dehydrogenase (short-subunit alcohol dehydrogenase family)